LIFDNVEDETPAPLAMTSGRSSVLITTRLKALEFLIDHTAPLEVLPFTEGQCFELFRRESLGIQIEQNRVEAQRLFERLGYLPMAVVVAARLIRTNVCHTIETMVRDLPADTHGLLRTAIEELPQNGQILLSAMAICPPEGFYLSQAAEIAGFSESHSLEALQEIHRRSLVEELNRSTHLYQLHALVREAAAPLHSAVPRIPSDPPTIGTKLGADGSRDSESAIADWQTAFALTLRSPKADPQSILGRLGNSPPTQ
jgi:hypothetical protein